MEPLRIVSIGAHPADVFDQCGGTLAHHVKRGDYVACICLTHGARVHDELISNHMFHQDQVPDGAELLTLMRDRTDVKVDEVKAACKILGIEDVYFFGVDDAVLLVTEQNVKGLARILRELKPDIVLTHFPKEGDGLTHAHAVAGQIAVHAIGFAGCVDPGDKNPPHYVAQTFFFGDGAATVRCNVWDSEGGYYNDVFIDIEDVVEKKLAAMDCLVSQGYGGAYARKRLETSDGAFGHHATCSYAEGFISANAETHHYLPLTDHALTFSRLSDHEKIARRSHRISPD